MTETRADQAAGCRAPSCPGARDPPGNARAVRRERRARRPDRGHRARGRRQPGDHLPPLQRQGRALRAHPRQLSRGPRDPADGGVASTRKTPPARLVAVTEEFIDFGVEYPAFVDCAQTLMRRPGPELLEEISESSLFLLGRGISACLTQLSDVLDAGVASRRLQGGRLDAARQPHVRQRASGPSSSLASGCSSRSLPPASLRSHRSRPSRCASTSSPRRPRSPPPADPGRHTSWSP